MKAGDTYQPDAPGAHLWVILTDVNREGNVVTASVTTWRENKRNDESCLLDRGDHPSIMHKSFVAYFDAAFRPLSQLEWPVRAGLFKQRESVRLEILDRMRAGAIRSPFTPRMVRAELQRIIEP